MSKINIAFGVTKDWLKYTYVTICSILLNASPEDEYNFYILCDQPDENFEQIRKKLQNIYPYPCPKSNYHFIKMNNSDFYGVIHDTRVGVSASYRLKLPSLVKEDKILYLDSDLVVLGDIKELWEYDINDYLIGAVEDKYSEMMACHANLPEGSIYINSGVMLMNLKKFRQTGLETVIFNKLRENNTYSDQDVINDICQEQILYLPLKYNLMVLRGDTNSFPNRREEFETSLLSPFIIHYTIKPWILPVQYSEYWIKYAKLLGF